MDTINTIEEFAATFESLKEYAADGTEIWSELILMRLLGYDNSAEFNQIVYTHMNTMKDISKIYYKQNPSERYFSRLDCLSIFMLADNEKYNSKLAHQFILLSAISGNRLNSNF